MKPHLFTRRRFLGTAAAAVAAPSALPAIGLNEIPKGERPKQAAGLKILNPRGRVPVSFIIDDSTCLVNMGKFCMPQFAEAHPDRKDYKKDWKSWPDEIPDSFVRKYGEWCREHGVKGKYSVVPYPACVGWMDRFIPGWSKKALQDSLALVRDLMMPDWDIHPEMISHTRVLNLKTGRPFEEVSRHTMENSHPGHQVSADYMAEYIAYALRILKNVDLPCEGFTTPGGFGNRSKSELGLGGLEALRDVFKVEVPHYFKYLETGKGSTAPRIEHASGLDSDDPKCIVNVIGGTGDWFGGWDGVSYGDLDHSADRFITADFKKGRMVEMIGKNEPAIMLCHWPGIYCNGEEIGFEIFKKAVTRVNQGFRDRILWMKLSEIARYWAAKELTTVTAQAGGGFSLKAPFAAKAFTASLALEANEAPTLGFGEKKETVSLREVGKPTDLVSGTWVREATGHATVCFDLPKGATRIA